MSNLLKNRRSLFLLTISLISLAIGIGIGMFLAGGTPSQIQPLEQPGGMTNDEIDEQEQSETTLPDTPSQTDENISLGTYRLAFNDLTPNRTGAGPSPVNNIDLIYTNADDEATILVKDLWHSAHEAYINFDPNFTTQTNTIEMTQFTDTDEMVILNFASDGGWVHRPYVLFNRTNNEFSVLSEVLDTFNKNLGALKSPTNTYFAGFVFNFDKNTEPEQENAQTLRIVNMKTNTVELEHTLNDNQSFIATMCEMACGGKIKWTSDTTLTVSVFTTLDAGGDVYNAEELGYLEIDLLTGKVTEKMN